MVRCDVLVHPWSLVFRLLWSSPAICEQLPVSAVPQSPWAVQRKAHGDTGPGPGAKLEGNQSDTGTGAVQVQRVGEYPAANQKYIRSS